MSKIEIEIKTTELIATDKRIKFVVSSEPAPKPGKECIECGSRKVERVDHHQEGVGWTRQCGECHAMWGVQDAAEAPSYAPKYYLFHHTSSEMNQLMRIGKDSRLGDEPLDAADIEKPIGDGDW